MRGGGKRSHGQEIEALANERARKQMGLTYSHRARRRLHPSAAPAQTQAAIGRMNVLAPAVEGFAAKRSAQLDDRERPESRWAYPSTMTDQERRRKVTP